MEPWSWLRYKALSPRQTADVITARQRKSCSFPAWNRPGSRSALSFQIITSKSSGWKNLQINEQTNLIMSGKQKGQQSPLVQMFIFTSAAILWELSFFHRAPLFFSHLRPTNGGHQREMSGGKKEYNLSGGWWWWWRQKRRDDTGVRGGGRRKSEEMRW